jgi:hypothetical protein
MARIGQQRDRAREKAEARFDDDESEIERDAERQSGARPRCAQRMVVMIVVMVVRVVRMRVHRVTLPKPGREVEE